MEILVVSATQNEVQQFTSELIGKAEKTKNLTSYILDNSKIDVLISGIGGVFSTYTLTKLLCKKRYDFIINAGIAGSFSESFEIGQVVQVESEEFGDLGVEDHDAFNTLFETYLMKPNEYPFTNGKLVNINDNKFRSLASVKKVKGLTVNTTHGNNSSIEKIKSKFDADIETMEGAYINYVCMLEKIPFIQLRGISNYVEVRNINNWKIQQAANNLNTILSKFVKELIRKN